MNMAVFSFKAVIEIRGINPFIRVSSSRAATIKRDWHKPLPVLLRINRKPEEAHRINMMPSGDGSFYLYLNNVVRTAANVSVGDRVSVELDFDAGYLNGPQHPVPAWFKDGLEGTPRAQQNWEALPPSRKKEILRYFAQLKSTKAQSRNLQKVLKVLSGEPGRFMARSWRNGT
jgi:hypothetical protein